MFYYLFYPLNEYFKIFNVFKYITFRSAYAAFTSLLIIWLFCPYLIRTLKRIKIKHSTGSEKLNFHLQKVGTPTMGGLIILLAVLFSTFLWGNLGNRYILLLMFVTLCMGIIGVCDDYLKIKYDSGKGLSARKKLILQTMVALVFAIYLEKYPIEVGRLWVKEITGTAHSSALLFPFFKNLLIDMGIFYMPFVVLVVIGSSNAVNITDGLDGLAIGCCMFVGIALGGLTYVTGHWNFSKYLHVPFIKDSGEIVVFIAAMVGASLGFLWYNTFPAQIFMGDTGSLSLGSSIGAIAVIIKKELLLIIIGGIFVAEAMSVILQVGSYKWKRKRILLMAPLHHHYELKGWSEPKIVVRFWIISVILVLISLSTLKLR